MRLFRNVVILACVLVALIGTAVFLNNSKKKSETVDPLPTSSLITLMEAQKDKITDYTIEDKKQNLKFTVSHEGSKWALIYPAGVRYSGMDVENMANNFTEIQAAVVIEEDAKDLKKYGLDIPTVVTVRTNDGKEQIIEIGNNTPTNEDAYVKKKDSNKVYTVSTYTMDSFRVAKYSFWDKSLFSMLSTDVQGMTLERAGELVFKAKRQNETDWNIVEPLESEANASKLEVYLNSFPSLAAKQIEEDKPTDLSEFGLDKPSYSVTLDTKQGTKKLLLGTEVVKGEEIYGKLDDSNTIYVLPVGSLGYLDQPLIELIEGLVYAPDIRDVSEFSITIDGKTTNCKVQIDPDNNNDKDKFFIGDKEFNQKNENGESYVRNYYKAIIGIACSDLEIGAKPVGTPEVIINYTLKKSPGSVKLEYVPKDGNNYYVVINGKYSGKLAKKMQFGMPDGVKDSYSKMITAMNGK